MDVCVCEQIDCLRATHRWLKNQEQTNARLAEATKKGHGGFSASLEYNVCEYRVEDMCKGASAQAKTPVPWDTEKCEAMAGSMAM